MEHKNENVKLKLPSNSFYTVRYSFYIPILYFITELFNQINLFKSHVISYHCVDINPIQCIALLSYTPIFRYNIRAPIYIS